MRGAAVCPSRSLVLRQYAGRYARASVHASTLSASEALFRFCLLAGIRLRLAMVRNTVAYMIGGAPWTKSGEPRLTTGVACAYVENPVLFWGQRWPSHASRWVRFRLLWRSWPSATFVFVMAICPLDHLYGRVLQEIPAL